MNEIYIFGCSCGAKGRKAFEVQEQTRAKLYNTKRDSEKLKQHINYLQGAGLYTDDYPAIFVKNGGEQVTLLNEWKQQA